MVGKIALHISNFNKLITHEALRVTRYNRAWSRLQLEFSHQAQDFPSTLF